ncbi:hypothetical protein MTR67_030775 [Solanum verrucosum]|uniref:Uncharacterized protein n=1 Tax=Solanum verrucosum TaxID=315347 RepID=A0AAF0U182_SOLVR|nr:hypothetical protein MTR67_030775 [Solanum verrucosum]
MMSKSCNLGGVGKISPSNFQTYQEMLLTPPDLGVTVV